eukprot:SAG31_NODE_18888_length_619_cov_0.976923_1_plen_81_part_00
MIILNIHTDTIAGPGPDIEYSTGGRGRVTILKILNLNLNLNLVDFIDHSSNRHSHDGATVECLLGGVNSVTRDSVSSLLV